MGLMAIHRALSPTFGAAPLVHAAHVRGNFFRPYFVRFLQQQSVPMALLLAVENPPVPDASHDDKTFTIVAGGHGLIEVGKDFDGRRLSTAGRHALTSISSRRCSPQ
ncbi:MAG: hypothetical protein JWO94_3204 [Verrucomicrobiaceae bacterium]|nr:hypothetical protein [Verrucomicrobiaceae bacterium]